MAKVIQRFFGPVGVTVGTYDDEPSLKSIVYDVEFLDGTIIEFAANVLAESMLTQVDEDGYPLSLMEGIDDYKRDHVMALFKEYKYVVTRR